MKSVSKKKPVVSKLQRVLDAASVKVACGSKSWFTKLKPADQKWVQDIKTEYKAGKYPNLTATSIAKAVSDELGIEITGQSMRHWFRKT